MGKLSKKTLVIIVCCIALLCVMLIVIGVSLLLSMRLPETAVKSPISTTVSSAQIVTYPALPTGPIENADFTYNETKVAAPGKVAQFPITASGISYVYHSGRALVVSYKNGKTVKLVTNNSIFLTEYSESGSKIAFVTSLYHTLVKSTVGVNLYIWDLTSGDLTKIISSETPRSNCEEKKLMFCDAYGIITDISFSKSGDQLAFAHQASLNIHNIKINKNLISNIPIEGILEDITWGYNDTLLTVSTGYEGGYSEFFGYNGEKITHYPVPTSLQQPANFFDKTKYEEGDFFYQGSINAVSIAQGEFIVEKTMGLKAKGKSGDIFLQRIYKWNPVNGAYSEIINNNYIGKPYAFAGREVEVIGNEAKLYDVTTAGKTLIATYPVPDKDIYIQIISKNFGVLYSGNSTSRWFMDLSNGKLIENNRIADMFWSKSVEYGDKLVLVAVGSSTQSKPFDPQDTYIYDRTKGEITKM